MSARDAILGRIRRSLGVSGSDVTRRATVANRLVQTPTGVIPARGQVEQDARVELFQSKAEAVQATVLRLADYAEIPAAVAEYLRNQNLPQAVRHGTDPRLTALPWTDQAQLSVSTGPSDGHDLICVSHADYGIAESGTLVMTSGADNPTTLNFLPDFHIVVLAAANIVGDYETAFRSLRERFGVGQLPRTINMISGPSRSADIEQKLLLGAHGPRSLHILLVG